MIIEKGMTDQVEAQLKAEGFHLHHSAKHRGYISRKTEGKLEPYKGRFGTGYRWLYPLYSTSQYMGVEYWVK